VVCPSVCLSVGLSHTCTLLKPLDGMRCHLANHQGDPCGLKYHYITQVRRDLVDQNLRLKFALQIATKPLQIVEWLH